jgi:ribosomal RNA assembly protein
MPLNKDRIAVLIGKNGETKKKIEQLTGTKLIINSENGEFTIEPTEVTKDMVNESEYDLLSEDIHVRVYQTNFIVEAINHGFNPDKALKLLDPDYMLELINLEEILGQNERRITRIKGRLIGEKGKIRSSIEQFTGVFMSVYGKMIAIIGDFETSKIAKKGITMLLQGSPHKTVLNYLQKEYQDRKRAEFTEMWKPTL